MDTGELKKKLSFTSLTYPLLFWHLKTLASTNISNSSSRQITGAGWWGVDELRATRARFPLQGKKPLLTSNKSLNRRVQKKDYKRWEWICWTQSRTIYDENLTAGGRMMCRAWLFRECMWVCLQLFIMKQLREGGMRLTYTASSKQTNKKERNKIIQHILFLTLGLWQMVGNCLKVLFLW